MLLNLIAIAVGYVGVILLLSLAVTSIVELIQATFLMRRQILASGLEEMLKAADANIDPDKAPKKLRNLIPKDRIERDYLPALVTLFKGAPDPDLTAKLDTLFPLMEQRSSERFKAKVRTLNVIVGFLVAFIMQASTTAIIQRLMTDATYRDTALAMARGLDSSRAQWQAEPTDFSAAAAQALETLAANHADLRDIIEQASGEGAEVDFILTELGGLLEDHAPAQRTQVLAEYQQLIAADARADAAVAQLARVEGSLAALELTPWRRGWSFYSSFSNWIGVILTGMLLTMGAPFWFDTLKRLLGILQTARGNTPPK